MTLPRIVTLLVFGTASIAPVFAQAQPAFTATSAYSTIAPGTPNARGRWDLTYTLAPCATCGDAAFVQVVIDVKPPLVMSVLDDQERWAVTSSPTGEHEFTWRGSRANKVVLRVRAEGLLSTVAPGVVKWRGQHSGSPGFETGAIEGPVAAAAPKGKWSTLVGGGFSFLRDDHADFEIEQDVLVIKNDSKWRATALTGIAFDLGKKVGLLAGLEYTAGTSALLDAFSAGVTYPVGDATLVLGISRAKGRELSAGFERAAAAYVIANPGKFPAVTSKADELGLGSLASYDGLPVKDIGYKGRVITDSWNTSFFVGVAFPSSIKLGNDKDRAQLAKGGGDKKWEGGQASRWAAIDSSAERADNPCEFRHFTDNQLPSRWSRPHTTSILPTRT